MEMHTEHVEIGRKSTKRAIAGTAPICRLPASKITAKAAKRATIGMVPICRLPASKVTARKGRGVGLRGYDIQKAIADSKVPAQAGGGGHRSDDNQVPNAITSYPADDAMSLAAEFRHSGVKQYARKRVGKADAAAIPIGRAPSPTISAQAEGGGRPRSDTHIELATAKITRRKAVSGQQTVAIRNHNAGENSALTGGGVGQRQSVTRNRVADSKPIARHSVGATHMAVARTPVSQEPATLSDVGGKGTQSTCAPTSEAYMPVVNDVVDRCRQRTAWMLADLRLTLQASGICRSMCDGDKDVAAELFARLEEGDIPEGHEDTYAMIAPLLSARLPLRANKLALEKLLVKDVRKLPAYGWVKSIRGFGDMSFACVIGETGDLAAYANPAKVWKRLGLALVGDKRQGNPGKGATAADWETHGYVKRRRSVMWNAGNGIIGGMGRGPRLEPGQDPYTVEELTDYQRLFVTRIRYDARKAPFLDVKTKLPLLDDTGQPISVKVSAKGKESFTRHAAAMAKRYVEKRVLRDLWRAWRRDVGMPEGVPYPGSE